MTNFRFTAACLLTLTTSVPVFASNFNNNNYGVVDPATGIVGADHGVTNPVPLNPDRPVFKGKLKDYSGVMTVELPGTNWPQLQAQLTHLIEKTIADPTYEKREFIFNVLGEDFLAFYHWNEKNSENLKYPIGMSGSNLDRGQKKPCGFHDHKEMITISNYTLKEQRSRQTEADVCEFYNKHGSSNAKNYNFLVSKLDLKKINHRTFHNLLVRANLGPDELYKGVHDSSKQTPIDVLPITLLKTNLDEAVLEFQSLIRTSLKESMKQYVMMVFSLDLLAKFNVNDLYGHKIIDNMDRTDSYFGYASTIVESDENRIYLLFNNSLRSTLDFHGLTKREAKEKLIDFIHDKYETFETHFSVMTGQGNTPGSVGLLKRMLPEWLDDLDDISDLIKSYGFDNKNPGICHIVLHAPLSLTHDPHHELPDYLKQMMVRGSVRAARPDLYDEGVFIFSPQYGLDDKPVEIKETVNVRLEDDPKYLPRVQKAKNVYVKARKQGQQEKAINQKVQPAKQAKPKNVVAPKQVQKKAVAPKAQPAKPAQPKNAAVPKQAQQKAVAPKAQPVKQAQPKNAVAPKQAQQKAVAPKAQPVKQAQPKKAPAPKQAPLKKK